MYQDADSPSDFQENYVDEQESMMGFTQQGLDTSLFNFQNAAESENEEGNIEYHSLHLITELGLEPQDIKEGGSSCQYASSIISSNSHEITGDSFLCSSSPSIRSFKTHQAPLKRGSKRCHNTSRDYPNQIS